MMTVSEHTDILSDQELSRIILIVRNYYQETDQAEAMWAEVKSDHSLFDFNNIISLTDGYDYTVYSRAWEGKTHALFPRFYTDSRHSITFLLEEPDCTRLISILSEKYPTLELMTVSAKKSTLYSSDRVRFIEFKEGKSNTIWASFDRVTQHLLSKVFWQSEFKEPIAYDFYQERTVFLDKPEELSYAWQNKNFIYYASHVQSIFDIKTLIPYILSKPTFAKSSNSSHLNEFVYFDPKIDKKEEDEGEEDGN